MKILAFAATNHKKSINQKLVKCSLKMFQEKHEIKQIDLNNFDMALFAPHKLEKDGLPKEAQEFCKLVDWADLIIISFAEYNGSYTPVFKNLLDWASTTKEKLWAGKEMILLATSPGGRGAKTVLEQASSYFPFMGAIVAGSFSLPKFHENLKRGKIVDTALHTQLENLVLSAESNPIPEHTKIVKFINKLAPIWTKVGYGLVLLIVLNGWLGAPLFPVTSSNIYWEIAMYAATFTLIIRPIYDFFPGSDVLRALLKWRKGIGLISSGIVISFWLSRNVSLTDITPLLNYFSATKWNFTVENVLERTTEITALTLFLISNKWMVLHFNKLWRQLQKLAYVYFLSAAILLTVVHEKTYGLVCLILFFAIYQAWIYKRLMQPQYNTHSEARRSQAS